MNAAKEKLAQRAMAGVSQKTPSAWVRGNLGSEDIGGKKVITVLVPSSCTETDDELAVEGAARIALRATSRCVAAGGSDTRGQPEWDRDYLNSLVKTSAANTDNQEGDIAFVKTHKTGSTTMAAILYRYAIRHDMKIAHSGKGTSVDLKKFADEVEEGSRERVDIMHYHISGNGHLSGSWSDAYDNYLRIMQDPDHINFVTVMREPRSHFISYYYYYLQPDNQLSIEEFLTKHPRGDHQSQRLHNPLSAEFGVATLTQMEHLIAHELSVFKLIFPTERFDEGLMVLRRLLGWSMIDMTYLYLNETKAGAKRWDGKTFVDPPSFDDLPEKIQNKIDDLTLLDQLLYTAAQEEYTKRLEPVSDVIEADLGEFQELQNVISEYLNANDSSQANAMYRSQAIFNEPPPLNPF
eukprot:jgi/Undpi1/8523/HiC_scaffold_25.g10990.m1